MIDLRFRPLDTWPGPLTKARRSSLFRATYPQTLDLLEAELAHLSARSVVIQAGFALRDIRNDGWPRNGAWPAHPGVILSFESKNGALTFPCDQYDDWQANLRAIALSLEALRAVDRYGVTKRAEQYRGWAALPEQAGQQGFASAEEAAKFVARSCSPGFEHAAWALLKSSSAFESAYRDAAKRLHPDAGGTHEQFIRLQQAAELIRAHQGGGK